MHPGLRWRERRPNSRLIESIWNCSTPVAFARTAIADPCTSVALVKSGGSTQVVVTGPRTRSYQQQLPPDYICTTIRLKLGVSLKGMPAYKVANSTIVLSADARGKFWFEGRHLQFPDFENAEHLIKQLERLGHVNQQPLDEVYPVVHDRISAKTNSRKVRQLTGLSPYQLYQLRRMHQALRLLKQGMPAVQVAAELAFVDQPHFIRASKQFLGLTPRKLATLPQTT